MQARRDPSKRVIVLSKTSLIYAKGADAAKDRPAHVRAASAMVRMDDTWVCVQDDAHFLALLRDGVVSSVALDAPDGVRQFDTARGNKALKADLEAACLWGHTLVAFGSGSSDQRERLLLAPTLTAPRWSHCPKLYEALRHAVGEAELNIEGAFVYKGGLRLLQRGNGLGALNAIIDLPAAWAEGLAQGDDPPPQPLSAIPCDLGALNGVPLSFTDGIAHQGNWLFSAAAEASPNAIDDGPVEGSVVGWANDQGGGWAPLTDAAGELVPVKLEGIEPGDDGTLWGVVDSDDPTLPSEWLRLGLEGF